MDGQSTQSTPFPDVAFHCEDNPGDGQVYKSLIAVMKACGPIAKAQKNRDQGYSFRGIDDVFNSLHGIVADAGLVMFPHVVHSTTEDIFIKTRNGDRAAIRSSVWVKYRFIADDGSFAIAGPVLGQSIDYSDKAAGQAQSFAVKSALLAAFLIPVSDMPDGDKKQPIVTGRESQGPRGGGNDGGGKKEDKPNDGRINKQKRQKLVDTAAKCDLTAEEVSIIIREVAGVDRGVNIHWKKFDKVIEAMEAKGVEKTGGEPPADEPAPPSSGTKNVTEDDDLPF